MRCRSVTPFKNNRSDGSKTGGLLKLMQDYERPSLGPQLGWGRGGWGGGGGGVCGGGVGVGCGGGVGLSRGFEEVGWGCVLGVVWAGKWEFMVRGASVFVARVL